MTCTIFINFLVFFTLQRHPSIYRRTKLARKSLLLRYFSLPCQLFLYFLLFLIFINFDIVADIFRSQRISYIITEALIALLQFLNWTYDFFSTR